MLRLSRKLIEILFLLPFLFFLGCGLSKAPVSLSRIYFGTNRAISFNNGVLSSSEGPGNQLLLGDVDVSIDEGYQALQFANMTPRDGEVVSQDQFISKMKSGIQTDGNDILVFIHGYNNSFMDSIKTVLQMKTDENLSGPMFAFSWPSAGSTFSYLDDEQQAMSNDTARHFRSFMELILQNSAGKRVHFIAHSMGNRVLLEGLRSYVIDHGNTDGITDAVFVAPDEVLNIFKATMELVFGKSRSTRYSLYVNRNDRALQASKTLRNTLTNGADSRAGAIDLSQQTLFGNENYLSRGSVGVSIDNNIKENFTLMDVSDLSRPGNSDHAYFRDHRLVVDDLSAIFHGANSGPRRTRRTDFAGMPYFIIPQ